MTTTNASTGGVNPNPTNTTGSNQSGGGKYLVAVLILVAVFFLARGLTADSSIIASLSPRLWSDTPTAVQTPPLDLHVTPAPTAPAATNVPQ